MCDKMHCLKIASPVFQVRIPERSPLMHHWIFASDTVDENIEAPLLLVDTLEERLYLRFQRVIDTDSNRTTTGHGDHFSGLFYCFLSFVRRRVVARAAAGAVDDRPCLSKRAGDAASRAPGGARNDSDLSAEWHHATDHK